MRERTWPRTVSLVGVVQGARAAFVGLHVAANARRARSDLGATKAQAVSVACSAALLWLTGPTLVVVLFLSLLGVNSVPAYVAVLAPWAVAFLLAFVAGVVGNSESLLGRGHKNIDAPFANLLLASRYLRP